MYTTADACQLSKATSGNEVVAFLKEEYRGFQQAEVACQIGQAVQVFFKTVTHVDQRV